MKLLVLMEIDAPKAIADTIQRTGFELVPDGTHMRVKVPNSPGVSRRKIKVKFATNPAYTISDLLHELTKPISPDKPQESK